MKTKLSLLLSDLGGFALMMTALAIFSTLFILAILGFGLFASWVTGAEDHDLFRKMFWPLVWYLSGMAFFVLLIAMVLESLPFHFKKFYRQIVKPAISSLILLVLVAIVLSIFEVVPPLIVCVILWFLSTAWGYSRATKGKAVHD